MRDLDVIIPVHNEVESVEEMVNRLGGALSGADLDYRIIFVDDYSTDGTDEKIKEFIKNGEVEENVIYDANEFGKKQPEGRVVLVYKKGLQGKAYSILEGARVATAPFLAIIDGDLQYPPEAIPAMYELAKEAGVAVANRKVNNTGLVRRIGTKANMLIFEKLLNGFDCDTQSGLKVFRREIIEYLDAGDVTSWTLDMPLLWIAREIGYEIKSFDIEFSERKSGESKLNFTKAAFEIALSAVKLSLKKNKNYSIKPENGDPYLGAGIARKGKRFVTHTHLPVDKSALDTFSFWQKTFLLVALLVVLAGFITAPIKTGIVLITFLTILYIFDLIFSFHTLSKTLNDPNEIEVASDEINKLNEDALPFYTILCPLYKEANVLPHFIEAIDAIDWPKDKLDVKLLLEEDDKETIEAANELNLPDYFSVLVVPDAHPKTKPKACNYGLAQSKGEYVVIYDAEDRPDPLQLKKAYLGFQKSSTRVVCLQSKLNYYNSDQNLLTRLFTAEYSLWFDLVLPGLQAIKTTIPLGGTSNHFKASALRYLDGWDPFNVTEDCDLGTRLFKKGFKTAIINSTTYEEANSKLGSWIKQRSRWIKGYMQTYLVHMRDPLTFIDRHGIHALVFQLVIGMRMTFMIINPILWTTTASYFLIGGLVGATIESLYPPFVFYPAISLLVFGNFFYIYAYMVGCAKREKWELMKYIFFIPFYWFFASIAAVKGFYQLLTKPYYWEKTTHGLHLGEVSKGLLPEINVSFEFDRSFELGGIKSVAKPFYMPFISFARNVVDFIDLFWPLPETKNPGRGGLRLLIFNWRDTKHAWAGGAEVYVHEIAKRWAKEGNEVTVFCGWDGHSKRNEVIDGVRVIRRGGFYSVYLWAALYYIFRFSGKYDAVVDCENGVPFFTPLFSKVPKVLLIHHVHQEVFRKHLPVHLASLAMFLENKLMPYIYQGIKIITVSESSKKDIVQLGWSGEDEVEIVNPGVELNRFKKLKKTPHPSFVYLGRLQHYKNIDLAIKAFAEIYKKRKDAKLTIAGFGESLEYLEKTAERHGLSSAVNFAGFVSEEDKEELLARSWAALQPSSFEGWGITVMEANASGTPVIASDTKGLKDSVADSKTGLLFPVGDKGAMVDAMETVVRDKEKREELSENAYKWVRQFSWNSGAGEFLEIVYKQLAPEKRRAYSESFALGGN